MYGLKPTTQYRKDYQRCIKRGYDISFIDHVVEKLETGEALEEKYRDHALTGNWTGYRECHITPDWLLIYKIEDDILILVLSRTGTHSDIF